MAGYLKAANEMRQSYFSGEVGTGRESYEDPGSEGGAFPDAAVVRSGNEEMILFPSYARKHVKSKVSLNKIEKTELITSVLSIFRCSATHQIHDLSRTTGRESGTSIEMIAPSSM